MTRRAAFSQRKVIETLLIQGAVIPCYRCRVALTLDDAKTVEREHIHELELGGADAPENCAYSHKKCHAEITNGTPATSAGSSKNRIAKVNRLTGQNKPKAKANWPRRPMGHPTLKKKIDGAVVERRDR